MSLKDDVPKRALRSELKLKNYRVMEVLGQGAVGTVYKAIDIHDGHVVAIKSIPNKFLNKNDLTEVQVEIELLQKLKHPNIVQYIETVKSDNSLNIILEFIEGGSLYKNLSTMKDNFDETLAAIYIEQILQGLKYLHGEGVVHRDVKAANILLTKDGVTKLSDFGVATSLSNSDYLQKATGSPYWMAPEVVQMTGFIDFASDIWSIGCTIIELLTGKPPYFELAQMPAFFRIVEDEHPPLPPDISKSLEDFLLICFRKDPKERMSAAQLISHLWITENRAHLMKRHSSEKVKRAALLSANRSKSNHSLYEKSCSSFSVSTSHFSLEVDNKCDPSVKQPTLLDLNKSLLVLESLNDENHIEERLETINDYFENFDKKNIAQKSSLLMGISRRLLELMRAFSRNPGICVQTLKLVDHIAKCDIRTFFRMCLMGFVNALGAVVIKTDDYDVKKAAFKIVKKHCMVNDADHNVRQIFIASGGLEFFGYFFGADLEKYGKMMLLSFTCIEKLLEGKRKRKTHYCDILAQNGMVDKLAFLVANMGKVVADDQEKTLIWLSDLFKAFSACQMKTKEALCSVTVMKTLAPLLSSQCDQIALNAISCLANLTKTGRIIDRLKESKIIPFVVDLVSHKNNLIKEKAVMFLSDVLQIHSELREVAALHKMIPKLVEIILSKSQLCDLAVPLFCKMAFSGEISVREIRRNDGVYVLIGLLENRKWQAIAIEASFQLATCDPNCEEELFNETNIFEIIWFFESCAVDVFEKAIDSVARLLQTSSLFLVRTEGAFLEILQRRAAKMTSVRAKMEFLKIVKSALDHKEGKADVLKQSKEGLMRIVEEYRESGKIMVADFADKILDAAKIKN